MSNQSIKYGPYIGFILVVIVLFSFSYLAIEVRFPVFEYASDNMDRRLVPDTPYYGIAGLVSRFLWENRALDLISQAFVIVAAVICCLAMLKVEEESG